MPNDEILNLDGSLRDGLSVFLSWELVSGTDIIFNKYYTIYYNSETQISTAMNTVLNLQPYTTYQFYVTSTNITDEESIPSNMITITTSNFININGALASGTRPFPNSATQITIQDLYRITPISNSANSTTPVFINPSIKPFYQRYIIDPKGELFGSTPCGYHNFMKYTTTL